MTEEQKEKQTNTMEEDLFGDSNFVYYKEVTIINRNDPSKKTKYKFGLKEITGADSDRVSKGALSVNAKTGRAEIDQELANVKFLKAVLVDAPFEITEQNIRRLSTRVRDELLDAARQINELGEDIEKK